jgi:outer membrane protein assembly factor BamB
MLAGCDWTAYLGGQGHASSSPDRGIHPSDVSGLQRRWRWHPATIAGRPGSLFSTPVTWRGRVFIGANNGHLVALDAVTGTVQWDRDFGYQPHFACNAAGIASTPAVRGDGNGNPIVYLNAPDGYLYELDGTTGDTLWKSEVQVPSTTENDSYAWSSPTVAHGRIYVGITSGCDTPFVRGGVRAYDAQTGAPIGTAWTMPEGFLGAGVWTSVAADTTSLYITTGSTDPQTETAHPPTVDNGFDQYSMVKIDATTFTVTGKWVAPITTGDPDFGSSPILFAARLAENDVEMVGACNKDGSFYALRADTMQLVWSRQIGTADDAGETACLSGGVWDGTRLFVAGNTTTIGGTTVPGSVRQLDPATGAVIWTTPLGANPLGSGSVNANGLLAYAGTDWSDGPGNGITVLDSTTGSIVRTLDDLAEYPEFAQPVWSDGRLFTANTDALVMWSR